MIRELKELRMIRWELQQREIRFDRDQLFNLSTRLEVLVHVQMQEVDLQIPKLFSDVVWNCCESCEWISCDRLRVHAARMWRQIAVTNNRCTHPWEDRSIERWRHIYIDVDGVSPSAPP